jgi:DNA polymerase-3 subunit epsilon
MRFIAFDTETTGTLPGVDRIIEIGAVRFVDGQVEAVYSTLVDPQIPIPSAASNVNGITDDMVVGQPKIDSLLDSFAEFCGDDWLVAHNAAFDFGFLTADIQRLEAKAPLGPILDTYAISKRVFPGLANYRLGTLVQHIQIEAAGFHRAEADAVYCGQLFLRMMEKVFGNPSVPPPLENVAMLMGKTPLRFPQIIPQPKQLDLLLF